MTVKIPLVFLKFFKDMFEASSFAIKIVNSLSNTSSSEKI